MSGPGGAIVVTVAPVHDCRDSPVLDPSSRGGIEPSSLRRILNPPDTAALELALRLGSRVPGCRVRVVSVAPPSAEGALRECLAAGADEILRIWGEGIEEADAHGLGAILAAAIRRAPFLLVLAGWRRADVEHGQTGTILAELLGLPLVSCARSVEPGRDAAHLRVEKRVPGTLLTISCPLPALVTVEKGPPLRYPRFPDRRRALRARIPVLDPAAVGLQEIPRARVRVERLTPPKPRRRSSLGDAGSMPAVARIRKIMSGGANARKENDLCPCPDGPAAAKIAARLLEEKLVRLP